MRRLHGRKVITLNRGGLRFSPNEDKVNGSVKATSTARTQKSAEAILAMRNNREGPNEYMPFRKGKVSA